MNVLVVLRVVIGLFFVFVSASKLIEPYQNFLYVIQNYEIFPHVLEVLASRVVPWVELFLGLFLVLGLWTREVLKAFLVLIFCFILIIGQALIRQLPITDCGCFGEWLSFPLKNMIFFDVGLLMCVAVLFSKLEKTLAFSLDSRFRDDN